MNFNANSAKQTHRLAAKRLPQEIAISTGDSRELTYNSYDQVPAYNGPRDAHAYPPSGPPQGQANVPTGTYNHNPPYNNGPRDAYGYSPSVPHQGQGVPYNPNYPANYPAESNLMMPTFDPMVANMAKQYGQHLMGTGKQYVDREIEKFVPIGRLKYYFAVDTSYVLHKLRLLFFPFTNQDWSLKYAPTEPTQPRFDVNAPDLYIPTMAYLTYVLVAGLALGMQDRFTPEVLGIQASSALIWTILEVLLYIVYLYIANITTSLTNIDIIAFAGYKFTGIIFAVLSSIIFLKTGYLFSLAYSSVTLAYFLLRTLKVRILSTNNPTQTGNTRRMYLMVAVAGLQPVLMWFLSYHLVPPSIDVTPSPPIGA